MTQVWSVLDRLPTRDQLDDVRQDIIVSAMQEAANFIHIATPRQCNIPWYTTNSFY